MADLALELETIPALLVLIGAPRLRRLGLNVPETNIGSPEHRLYEVLSADNPDAAHSRYNAWIRRLIRFERTLEIANSARSRS